MEDKSHNEHLNKVTLVGLLVTVGIVYGDIGTSPLYTFSAVIGTKRIEPQIFHNLFYKKFRETWYKGK